MERPTIKFWSEDDQPREKLIKNGKHNLTDAELLAILLRTGTGNESALDLARKVLHQCQNDLNTLSKFNIKELLKLKGIGVTKATSLLAAFEIGIRRNGSEIKKSTRITSSTDAASFLSPRLADLPHEEFWLLLLDRANNIIDKYQLSKGGVAGTIVDPKMIFKIAIDKLASGIILSHNHPSGNLKPSESDIKLTAKIKNAGAVLEIAVLDHIIISSQGYYSFADEGMM